MMSPGNRNEDLVAELQEELGEGILENEEALREEVEALGGAEALKAAVSEAQRDAMRAIGEVRRELVQRKARTEVVQRSGRYDGLSDEEVTALWVARTQGFDPSTAAVQFRDFEGVTAQDIRSLLEDLDRLDARSDGDENE